LARGNCTFRQRDVTAAIKAAVAAGREVARAEIDPATGKIIIVFGKPQCGSDEENTAVNEWDAA
jgi:hypothetical protein